MFPAKPGLLDRILITHGGHFTSLFSVTLHSSIE